MYQKIHFSCEQARFLYVPVVIVSSGRILHHVFFFALTVTNIMTLYMKTDNNACNCWFTCHEQYRKYNCKSIILITLIVTMKIEVADSTVMSHFFFQGE